MGEGDQNCAKAITRPDLVAPLTPAEIPGHALNLLTRQLQLVAAAQSEIARGLQPQRNKDGKVVGTELGADGATRAMGALVSGAKFLVDVHELFAPRAQAQDQDDRVSNEATATAAASKLLEAVKRDEVRAQAETIRPARPEGPRSTGSARSRH